MIIICDFYLFTLSVHVLAMIFMKLVCLCVSACVCVCDCGVCVCVCERGGGGGLSVGDDLLFLLSSFIILHDISFHTKWCLLI